MTAPSTRFGTLPSGFSSAHAEANGARLHFVRGGTGPAIILVHGFPEDWAAYRAIMPRLAERFTVVAVDLPGIGRSEPARGGYETANLAAQIHALAETLALERPYLVGHDLGGLTTYAYVRRYPESLRGAMILDVPVPGIAGWDEALADNWLVRFIQEPGLAEKMVPGRQAAFLGWCYDLERFTTEQRAYYIEAYDEPQLHAAFEIYRGFPRDGEWNAAQSAPNAVPLVVAIGETSFFAPFLTTFVEGYRAKGMTQVASAFIPAASHYVLADNPDAVAELIERHAEIDSKSRGGVTRREVVKGSAALVSATLFGSAFAGSAFAANAVTPFRVSIPQADLDDLMRRLEMTRWPEPETEPGWAQGVPLAQLQRLVQYWRTDYDWRRCEAQLNAFPQFRLEFDGLGIHFLHVRSRHEQALPIVLTHGWPGSILEFRKIIEPLTDPTAHGGRAEDAFHVIVPSLPGYGFSDKPRQAGWHIGRIARAWAELMSSLGYERWVAQGGDLGAFVTNTLALQRPSGLAAIHLNLPLAVPEPLPTVGANREEREAIAAMSRHNSDGGGYSHMHATRPQTLGYSLSDSPVGLAAWIYEKFHAWTDNSGLPESALSRDDMLDDVTLYWLTNTAASSARLYRECARNGYTPNQGVVDFPAGLSIFPKDVYRAPRTWVDRVYPNLIHWNELTRGGHFAAYEQPALFTRELRDCFRSVRAT